jgi:REP element-mobilizing transposase RayT
MARPLRINIPDGWYHVMGRGIERRDIFQEVRDYGRFLELLEDVSERYGVKIHAYALMPNHYHLLIQTPHANLSQAVWWLNVSYSVWFNVKRGRVGHVFQGRFKSVPVEGGEWVFALCDYIHLNPINVRSLGLGRKTKGSCSPVGDEPPTAEQVKVRLAKFLIVILTPIVTINLLKTCLPQSIASQRCTPNNPTIWQSKAKARC